VPEEITDQQEFEESNRLDPEPPRQPDQARLSLQARMEAHAEHLRKDVTEQFPVPGWESMLMVELKRLGYKRIRALQKRNDRVRDAATRELYSMCDQIITATVGFHEVLENGETQELPDDTWITLAQNVPGCPDEITPRQAILFLTGDDKRVHFLAAEWGEWSRAGEADETEEVRADFVSTG
jgi:hypothetical protein